jgi:hypothetical protein
MGDGREATVCVVTTISVRRTRDLVRLLRWAASIRWAERARGATHESFASVRFPRQVTFVSLWPSRQAVAEFATRNPAHARMVHWAQAHAGAVWSGVFELAEIGELTRSMNATVG